MYLHCNMILFQHHKMLEDLHIRDSFLEDVEDNGDSNVSINLLSVACTGNAMFLDELLDSGFDPDVGDVNGRTPLVCFSESLCLLRFIWANNYEKY